MTFELVTPYDPALIDAPSSTVAAAFAVGGARFLIRAPNTSRAWPNGEAPDAWFALEAGLSAKTYLESNRTPVTTALETVRMVGQRTCTALDIVGRARFYAKGLRAASCASYTVNTASL